MKHFVYIQSIVMNISKYLNIVKKYQNKVIHVVYVDSFWFSTMNLSLKELRFINYIPMDKYSICFAVTNSNLD